MRTSAALLVFAVALVAGATDWAVANSKPSAQEPVAVQFRTLFFGNGKPSVVAASLRGRTVEMIGFAADAPDEDSPFMVFVGAPTEHCPYCSSIDDQEHLPYILVYPQDEVVPEFHGRTRLRVVGRIDVGHENEGEYGIHNDVRLIDATVEVDELLRNRVLPRSN